MSQITKLSVGIFAFFIMGLTPCFAQTTTYSYDAQGRLTAVDDSIIGDITYDYDDAGNLIDRTVGAGGGNSNSPPTCPAPYFAIVFNVNHAFVSPLGECSDPDGDTLIITAAEITSGLGANVIVNTPTRLYFSNLPCDLTFAEYTVSDGNGGTATGNVEIERFDNSCQF